MIVFIFLCFSSFRKYSGINKTRCYRDLLKLLHHVYEVTTSFGIMKNKLIQIIKPRGRASFGINVTQNG